MLEKIKPHATYANIVATIALIVAVSGGATAVALSLGKGSVTSKSIRKGAVTAPKLAPVVIRAAEKTGTSASVRAACAKGERVLSGGASASSLSGDSDLAASVPDGNGWFAQAGNSGDPTTTVVARVVCLKKR